LGIKNVAIIQNIIVKGNPKIKKSLNLYWPGAKTIRLVWYPIGVMKLVDAPKQIAIKNAFVGSTNNVVSSVIKWSPKLIASGDKIIATAALEIKADVIKVKKYSIDITAIICLLRSKFNW